MKRKSSTLNEFFHSVDTLVEKMHEQPYYDEEIKNLFSRAIPKGDMTRNELEQYFKDNLAKSEIIVSKLKRWYQGYLDDDLSKYTPNQLLNEIIIEPEFNPPLSINELHKIYKVNKTTETLRNWVNANKLIPSAKGKPRLYYRVDFEHLLINKREEFNKESVNKYVISLKNASKNINTGP
ncbi:MAG: hypothetical protein CMC13_14730 [Flavobacteriaceae bacterium]|nr:hypothetical protein [Flavobacteriaceae bacterium]|tara:strand:- start:7351 stop:7890 length:540 start_codon:yes stop_codon:yes gene_type:complete